MPTKCVDVFDRSGARVLRCSVVLDDEGCLDAEFEEIALVLAETSGAIAAEEIAHVRACCDRTPMAELIVSEQRHRPRNGAVVSLVKLRMKRAGSTAPAFGKNAQRAS